MEDLEFIVTEFVGPIKPELVDDREKVKVFVVDFRATSSALRALEVFMTHGMLMETLALRITLEGERARTWPGRLLALEGSLGLERKNLTGLIAETLSFTSPEEVFIVREPKEDRSAAWARPYPKPTSRSQMRTYQANIRSKSKNGRGRR